MTNTLNQYHKIMKVICPKCHHLLSVVTEDKILVRDEKVTTIISDLNPLELAEHSIQSRGGVTPFDTRMGREVDADDLSYEYDFKCKHCGHEWTEFKTKQVVHKESADTRLAIGEVQHGGLREKATLRWRGFRTWQKSFYVIGVVLGIAPLVVVLGYMVAENIRTIDFATAPLFVSLTFYVWIGFVFFAGVFLLGWFVLKRLKDSKGRPIEVSLVRPVAIIHSAQNSFDFPAEAQ